MIHIKEVIVVEGNYVALFVIPDGIMDAAEAFQAQFQK